MKKLLVILSASFIAVISAMAQGNGKYSASTQLFMNEQSGIVKLPKLKDYKPQAINREPELLGDDESTQTSSRRSIAEAVQVGGVKLVSAFVSVADNDFAPVVALGAVMERSFGNIATMMLPVDKIEAIAALENVKCIDVAEILEPLTDQSRSVTQALDAITNSETAQSLGLTTPYTGKGVILGVVDSGIDFQHIAFKDADGNSRIKRAYTLASGSSSTLTTHSTTSAIAALTTDNDSGNHGTHTSSTAGGSSVVINGDKVTVTNDHSNATYGGLAPEADLVISGLSSLYNTAIANSISAICDYADEQGKPCVISLSLGTAMAAHDGTGSMATVFKSCLGDNHIIVYSGSNNAMRPLTYMNKYGTSNGGGMYAGGISTKSKPLLVNIQRSFSNATGNYQLSKPYIIAYARTPGVAVALKFHVVNVKTGEIVYSTDEYTSDATIDLSSTSGLGKYYYSSTSWTNNSNTANKIELEYYRDSYNEKRYWYIDCPTMQTRSGTTDNNIKTSNYALCVSIYPTSANVSTEIDMWEGGSCWFGNDLTLSSSVSGKYNLVKGSDDCSSNNYASFDDIISVGAYTTKNI